MWLEKLTRGQSPLTDPRALLSSALFHLLLLIVVSVAALGAILPVAPPALSNPLRGELGPVDNQAPSEAGGSPGEPGGVGTIPVALQDASAPGAARNDAAAEALLSEILPALSSADAAERALPNPLARGVGLLPGPGPGGGGGSGGGSGGGVGRGIGPGTEFFGAREHAHSFAYVIDCSGSMAVQNALTVAQRELLRSLEQLPPDARFGVIFYNLSATIFTDSQGRQALMAATQANKARVRSLLAKVKPNGGTNHMSALRTALALRPEVIYFLTDADLMTSKDVEDILEEAGATRIQAIEFGVGPDLGQSVPLRRLAAASGGTYRYLDITRFQPPARE
jgi:hypothetical protein